MASWQSPLAILGFGMRYFILVAAVGVSDAFCSTSECTAEAPRDTSLHFSEASRAKVNVSKEDVLLQSRASVLKSHGSEASTTKFIAGVPVYNYHLAYEGELSLTEHGVEEKVEWVVVAKEGTSQQQLDEMCAASGSDGCNLEGSETGFRFVEFTGTEQELQDLLAKFPGQFEYAEPDLTIGLYAASAASGDEKCEGEWGSETPWGLERIGAPSRPGTGEGVTIYIFDTGVRTDHEEFTVNIGDSAQTKHQGFRSPRVVATADISTGRFWEVCAETLRPECALDLHGHGTHVAGIAVGASYGVAPAAKVAAVKVLDNAGRGKASWLYAALDKAVGHHVYHRTTAVALLGVGGSNKEHAFLDSVDMAVDAGVTVVVAAGNSNDNACDYAPAFVPSAITVGAGNSENKKADFSNYGDCVDIWAPGDCILSSGRETKTSSFIQSGTSMAAAHVAGAAAIALEILPRASPGDVFRKLQDLAQNVNGNLLLRIGAPSAGAPAAAPALPPMDR